MKLSKIAKKHGFTPNGWLAEEMEVDAKLVVLAMRGGMDTIMNWGLRNTDLFHTTQQLTDRVFSLKKMPKEYISAVSEMASELAIKYPNQIP